MSHSRCNLTGRQSKRALRRRANQRNRRQLGQLEQLESRVLLAADVAPWHNSIRPTDVDANNTTSPLDALIVINELNRTGGGLLGSIGEGETPGTQSAALTPSSKVDVNGDNLLTALDALSIFNYLNGEGEGDMLAQVQTRITDNLPAKNSSSAGRTDLTTITPGQTIRLEVYIQDIRDDDDPTQPGVGDQFGPFASYIDLEFDYKAFSVPAGTSDNAAGKPSLAFPISFKTPNKNEPLEPAEFQPDPNDPLVDEVTYRFPNGPKGTPTVAEINGVTKGLIDDVGSFLDSSTPPGRFNFFQFDIQFTAESLYAENDTLSVDEGSSATVNVLTNDQLVSGTKEFLPKGPEYFGPNPPAAGNEFLVFGETGGGSVSGKSGSIVESSQIMFVKDSVTIVNNGTLAIDEAQIGQGQFGTVVYQGNGVFQYTPGDPNATSDQFTYTIIDGQGNSKQATVAVTINSLNDPPQITAPAVANVDEDQTLNLSPTVSDGDGDDLSITLSVNDGALAVAASGVDFTGGDSDGSDGTLAFTGTIAQVNTALSGLTYDPTDDFNGSATLTITAADGVTAQQAHNVAITVDPINDAPELMVPGDQVINFTTLPLDVVFSTAQSRTISVSDPDGDVTVEVTFSVDSGSLTMSNTGGLDNVQGNGSSEVTIRGTTSAVNTSLASSLTYRSTTGASDTLTVTVDDLGNIDKDDSALMDTETVAITLVPPTRPFAVLDKFTRFEDSGASNLDVLANDFNIMTTNMADPTNLMIVAINPPAASVGTLVNNGTFLTFTPADDFAGDAVFSYTIEDSTDGSQPKDQSTASVTVTVTGINDEPTFAASDPIASLEDAGQVTVGGWAAFDPGPDNESSQSVLQYSVTVLTNSGLFAVDPAVSNGGTLTYTSAADAHGEATIRVTVQDNGGTANGGDDTSQPQTFTITVTPVNDNPDFTAMDPPTVNEDANAQTVNNWATNFDPGPADEGGQTLVGYTVSNVSNPSLFAAGQEPVVDTSGTLTYTPAADAFGSSTFRVTVQDSGGTADGGVDTTTKTFTITVNPVNDEPAFTANDPPASNEDAGPQTVPNWITSFDPGPDNESGQSVLQYIVSGVTNASLFSAGPAISPNGTLTYTVAADKSGSASFSVQVRDNGGTDNGGVDTSSPAIEFTLNVVGTNDLPVNTVDGSTSFAANPQTTDDNTELPFNATNNNLLQVTDPDDDGVTASYTVTLSVTNGELKLGGSQAASVMTTGTRAQVNTALAGLSFVPTTDFIGNAVLTMVSDDGGNTGDSSPDGTTDTDMLTITVRSFNDSPIAEDDEISTPEGSATTFNVFVDNGNGPDSAGPNENTFQDIDVQSFDASGVLGTVELLNAETGQFRYTPPDDDFAGQETFTYTIVDNGQTDGSNDFKTASAEVTVTVTQVNDAPIAMEDLLLIDPNPVTGQQITFTANQVLGNDEPGPANESAQQLSIDSVNGDNVELVNGQIVFTVPADFNIDHLDTFTYTVIDNGQTNGVDAFLTDTAMVTIRDVVLATVSGFTYMEGDGSGSRSAGDAPIGNNRVRLLGTDVSGASVNLETFTDANGFYEFTNVLPSQAGSMHRIVQDQPVGMVDGPDFHNGSVVSTNDEILLSIPLLGFTNGAGAENNFSERSFSADFGSMGLGSILHAAGPGIGPGGLMFATDSSGNLSWTIKMGGWDNYTPGQKAAGSNQYQVQVTSSSVPLTDTIANQVRTAVDGPEEGDIRQKTTNNGSLIYLRGSADDFGLPLLSAASTTVGEGEGVFDDLATPGDAEQFASAVDAIFASAGAVPA